MARGNVHLAKVARHKVDGGGGNGGVDLRKCRDDGVVCEVGGVVVCTLDSLPCGDMGLVWGAEEVVVG